VAATSPKASRGSVPSSEKKTTPDAFGLFRVTAQGERTSPPVGEISGGAGTAKPGTRHSHTTKRLNKCVFTWGWWCDRLSHQGRTRRTPFLPGIVGKGDGEVAAGRPRTRRNERVRLLRRQRINVACHLPITAFGILVSARNADIATVPTPRAAGDLTTIGKRASEHEMPRAAEAEGVATERRQGRDEFEPGDVADVSQ
jgi:hypothetical protein